MTLDQATFRTVLGHFASGVCVVAGVVGGEPAGFSCQSVFSLSLEPPMIALAPSKASKSWPGIEQSGALCVNVLSDDQEVVCRSFARSGTDKFAGVGWSPAPTGSPRLADALAWMDCRIGAVHDAGDHWLVVAAVVALGSSRGQPLVFYRGGYGRFCV